MKRAVILMAPLALTACNPPPRAASYFKAHPQEAIQVAGACAAGTHRGAECQSAQAAEAQIQGDARLQLYKKSF